MGSNYHKQEAKYNCSVTVVESKLWFKRLLKKLLLFPWLRYCSRVYSVPSQFK